MTVLLLSLVGLGALGLDAIEVLGRTGLLLLDCFKSIFLAVRASSLCLSCSWVGCWVLAFSRSVWAWRNFRSSSDVIGQPAK